MTAPPEPQVIDFSPNDLAALQALGRRLGKLVARGDVICLNGPLGAGKTTMTQAMAQGMGLPADQPVTSPTYGIIHEHWGKHQEEYRGAPRREHQGQLPLFHLDLYRLGGTEEELLELGIEDYLYGDGVCVIEWPDRLGQLKPAVRLEVEIEFSGPTGRRVSLRDHAAGWTARLARESISQGV